MVDVVASPERAGTSYVEWGAVFAGAVAASAISFVLLTAGAALGLSLISPYAGESYAKTAASIAVLWSVAVPILAFLVGGYIAGRMRVAWTDASVEEVQFRDGVHGLLVWSLGIAMAAALTFLAATATMHSGAQVAAGAASNENAALSPVIDTLFGATMPAPDAPVNPAGTPQGVAPAIGERGTVPESDVRAMVARTLVAAAGSGQLTPAQKRTLGQVVAERTGVSQPEAERRVDQAFKDGMKAIETARQAAVLAALVTVTALLVSLLAAWYAAKNGGRHRDTNVPARLVMTFSPTPRRTPLP
ncbi:MAG: hypothetical protein WC829_15225 [Hyphomicrobium sp.]|jgi:hypothetical protein